MDIYWELPKKRKFSELGDENDVVEPKKLKLIEDKDKMIYALDTEIHFTEQITKITIETLIKKITKVINKYHDEYVGTDKKLNITFVIDSPGGCLSSTFKFIDFIMSTKKKYPYIEFTSVITGSCCSGASLITVIADKRQMTRLASVMIHTLHAMKTDFYDHLMSYSDHLQTQHEKMVKIYLDHSNCTRKQLETFLTNETWFDPETYLKLGFIDEII
jgi:ATP-dependent protease ClpP protease subunit